MVQRQTCENPRVSIIGCVERQSTWQWRLTNIICIDSQCLVVCTVVTLGRELVCASVQGEVGGVYGDYHWTVSVSREEGGGMCGTTIGV